MQGMAPAETAVLLELQLVRSPAFVFGRRIVATLAIGATQRDYISHSSNQNNRLPSQPADIGDRVMVAMMIYVTERFTR
jgi:hypothetical protein